jgi:ribosomal protein S18 acetylase RimI-like enzyme
MADQGWPRLHVTVVQVAPIAAVLVGIDRHDDLRAMVERVPSSDWRSLMHDLDTGDPEAHVAILTGPDRVGFATLYRGDQPVGIGRVSVEGEWAGVTSVDVAPAARRQGIGSAVMAALLGWAEEQGASSTYLQVRAANPAALKLYDALGYVTHHPYCYRAPAPERSGPRSRGRTSCAACRSGPGCRPGRTSASPRPGTPGRPRWPRSHPSRCLRAAGPRRP